MFRCEICLITFKRSFNLNRHLVKHGVHRPTIEKKYKCKLCFQQFNEKVSIVKHCHSAHFHRDASGLEDHLRQVHQIGLHRRNNIICPTCHAAFSSTSTLNVHLTTKHNFIPNLETLCFPSMTEFLEYKKDLETVQSSFFVKKSSSKGSVFYFDCHRSGLSREKENTKRAKWKSFKIGVTCPARIVVTVSASGIEAKIQKRHLGHDCSAEHLRLTLEERTQIAAKINMGVTADRILDDARQQKEEKQSLKRINLLRKKDLYNIRASFRLLPATVSETKEFEPQTGYAQCQEFKNILQMTIEMIDKLPVPVVLEYRDKIIDNLKKFCNHST